jgi:hypothetical protein
MYRGTVTSVTTRPGQLAISFPRYEGTEQTNSEEVTAA